MPQNPNKNVVQGQWREMKGVIQKNWGKLTDDELEKTKGDLKEVSGLIQKKYGKTQGEFQGKLTEIYKRFNPSKEKVMKSVKETLKQ